MARLQEYIGEVRRALKISYEEKLNFQYPIRRIRNAISSGPPERPARPYWEG